MAWLGTSSAAPALGQQTGPRIVLDARLSPQLQGCVSAERLQASYEKALLDSGPGDSGGPSQAVRTLWVSLRKLDAPGDHGLRLQLRAHSAERALGERVLAVRERDCAALPDTLALVLVLLSQSQSQVPTNPRPPAASAPPPTAVQGASRMAPARAREAPGAQPLWGVGVGVGARLGTLPSLAAATHLTAALQIGWLQGRLGASLLWPQALPVAEGSVRLSSYELALELCPTLWASAVALRLCLGPRLGLVRAVSRGFAVHNQRPTELSLYFGLLPEVAWAVGATTWLQFDAGGAVGLQRPRFVLRFQDPERREPLAGPRLLRAELSLGLMQIF